MADKNNKITNKPADAGGKVETIITNKPVAAEARKELKAPEGFELKNWPGGARIMTNTFGIIDLNTLTPHRAGQLVKRGFKFLEKK